MIAVTFLTCFCKFTQTSILVMNRSSLLAKKQKIIELKMLCISMPQNAVFLQKSRFAIFK